MEQGVRKQHDTLNSLSLPTASYVRILRHALRNSRGDSKIQEIKNNAMHREIPSPTLEVTNYRESIEMNSQERSSSILRNAMNS